MPRRQREGMLSRQIKNALKSRGHYVWKTHADQFSEAGIPDLIGYRFGDGRFIGLETKIDTSLSAVQSRFLDRCRQITNESARIGVVHSVDEAIAIVENHEWVELFGTELHKLRTTIR